MSSTAARAPLPATIGRLLLALVTLLSLGLVATPASATTSIAGVRLNAYESRLVSLVNAARADDGLRALTVTPGATDVARRWAQAQAIRDGMGHNPSFARQLAAAGGSNWTWAAENVGFGYANDPDGLFQLYMQSPTHRANILSPKARYLGMGVVDRTVDGWLMVYNTMNFNDSFDPRYGPSRVPADALPMDGGSLLQTRLIAGFEYGPDQREDATATGSVSVSAPQIDAPSRGDNAVRWTVRKVGGAADGHADFRLHEALDLTHATSVQIKLQADTVGTPDVPVTVVLARYGSDSVILGTAMVNRGRNQFTFALPAGARDFRDTVVLRVPSSAVDALPMVIRDRSIKLSLYAVRVVV
ncbi:MAG: hypothetical protein QOI42_616 [Frankiaceae bacterium]|nr:hypothetical protein [Frankiaceae bacterium]